ncbi:lipopolysaccharide biosynthesis protein [Streptomyces sp. NPDC051567]|uniref:lipopolysaccharide biosynthesis protein n=1 Tax=Streptomyces sp. NPDC051567 TaxID=3365660 RepID=UPI0037977917
MADTADQKTPDPGPGPQEPQPPQKSQQPQKKARRWPVAPPVWWPLPACALLGLAAGGAYGLLKAPEYTATSYVVAVPDDTTEPATALGFAQAYGRIATGGSVLAYAQPRAGVPAARLRNQVRAETSPESPMIAVTGTGRSPAEAADVANAVADALSLSGNQAAKNTGVRLLLFSQAVAPSGPSSASAPLSGAVGLCAGGLLGGLWLLAGPGRGRRPRPAGDGPAVEEYASLPAQGEHTGTKEKESAR